MPDGRPRISLCLSGGGFRATFFHLGVVRYLYDSGLLKDVTEIFSVSGGSILAAHLSQNWSKYTGAAKDFQDCVESLVRFGQFDLRGFVVRRWLLSIIFFWSRLLPGHPWKRTLLLQRFYSKHLYRGETLQGLAKNAKAVDRPQVHLLCTSMTTGFLCSFTHAGFWRDDGSKVSFIRSGLLPLSLAVAASSAFPPLFPPVILTRKMLDATTEEMPYDPELLTDGGVFDNLGVRKFQRLISSSDAAPDLVIVSDAGAGFDWQVGRTFKNIASRTVRATDILMKRVGDLERASIDSRPSGSRPRFIKCDISTVLDESHGSDTLDDNIQKRLGRLRTDLNRFSSHEINTLSRHGYAVCAQSFNDPSNPMESHWRPSSTPLAWDPIPNKRPLSVAHLAKELEKGRAQRLGLWNPRDWASWFLILVLVSIPSLILASFALNVAFVANAKQETVKLFFVTDRSAAGTFSTDFSNTGDFGTAHVGYVDVSIPSTHEIGKLEEPSLYRLQFKTDPARDVALVDIKVGEQEALLNELRGSLALSHGNLLTFIDGANTDFKHAALSDATFAYDLGTDWSLLDMSWPSGGVMQYPFAEDSAQASRLTFDDFLNEVCKSIPINKMSFVARGMGARLMMNTLSDVEQGASPCKTHFGEIILIYPDTSVQMFSELAHQVLGVTQRITIYRGDSPEMHEASIFHSYPRLGDAKSPVLQIPKVDVIDVPPGDSRRELFMDMIGVAQGKPADNRPGLFSVSSVSGKHYQLIVGK